MRIGAGPMSAPSAANSFTSPAPVPPSRWPGSISAAPSASPAAAAPTDSPLTPTAAMPMPVAASVPVNTFGTRRVRRSMAAATLAPATTAANTAGSNGLSNVLPERRVNRGAERGDAGHRDDRDQRGEKSVFQKILAVGAKRQAFDGRQHCRHAA